MKSIVARLLFALGLIAIGWTAGRAQSPLPDFELVIEAPEGSTNVRCVRGCQGLAWIERMVPGTIEVPTETTFSYSCANSGNGRCGSGRIGGWIKR
jgi:hypothetical protein